MKKIALIFIMVINSVLLTQQKPKFIHPNLECITCHTCEIPTKETPCLRACVREHLITVYHSADDAPEYINLDEFKVLEDYYTPVYFSHKLHAEMSHLAGGCQTCHHYNPPGSILSCKNCHENVRKREDLSKPDLKAAYHRQCMDCHRSWSHKDECRSCHELNLESKNKPKPAPEQIKRKHPKIEVPDKLIINTNFAHGGTVTFRHNEHVETFGIDCQSCHSNESCRKCHEVDKNIEQSINLEMKIHDRCSFCHNTEEQCHKCHSDQELPKFDHKRRSGWELNKTHAKISCQSCHKEKGKYTGLSRNCFSCHTKWNTDNFNHSVTGLTLNEYHIENECEDCHVDNNYQTPTCENCHDEDIKFPKDIPGSYSNK